MEDSQIYSAAAVWKDFNAETEDLNVSVVADSETACGVKQTQLYFNGRQLPDGTSVRVFARIFMKPSEKKLPVLVMIAPSGQTISDGDACRWAEAGYAVIAADNAGEGETSLFTIYPESIKYANFASSGRYLTHCDESAKQTSWYEWAANTRFAVTFMCAQEYADENRIGLISFGDGAIVACMAAAFDDRIKSCALISGPVWVEPDDVDGEDSESRDRWIAGIAPQSYLMFMNTPVYFSAGLNSAVTDIDRIFKVMTIIPQGIPKAALLVQGVAVDRANTDNLEKWFDITLGGKKLNGFPQATFVTEGGKLFAEVAAEPDAVKTEIFAASDTENKRARHWVKVGSCEGGVCRAPMDTVDGVTNYCFGNVKFNNGLTMSGNIAVLREAQLKEFELDNFVTPSKVIYRSSSGQMPFLGFDPEMCAGGDMQRHEIALKSGPYDISGAAGKVLATFAVNDSKVDKDNESALTFDVYSEQPQSLKVCFVKQYGTPEQTVFTMRAELLGGGLWQKVSVSPSEFHSETGRPPSGWSECQLIAFVADEEIMLNNVLFT